MGDEHAFLEAVGGLRGVSTRSTLDRLLSPAERQVLAGGLEHAILFENRFEMLTNTLIFTARRGDSNPPCPQDLIERVLKAGTLTDLTDGQLVGLATNVEAICTIYDAIASGKYPIWSNRAVEYAMAFMGVDEPYPDGTVKKTTPSEATHPDRAKGKNRWRLSHTAAALLLAACVLVAIGFGVSRFVSPDPIPPQYACTTRSAGGELGGPNTTGGQVIYWSLPPQATGFVVVLEVRPDGSPVVRPTTNSACQQVKSDRGGDGSVDLEVLFARDPREEVVVWLFLTEQPVAEALQKCVTSYKSLGTAGLGGSALPDAVLADLERQGVRVRATGRAVISPEGEGK